MDNKLELEILRINERITNIERRLDSVDKYSELIYKDRELIVEIQGSVAHLKEIVLSNQQHQDNASKDLKADIKEAQFATEDKVNEVKKVMEEKTVIVKSSEDNILKKIINKLKGVQKHE